ncbi:hypothetical protein NL676_028562 [Syzygium grande]|nr:hypothetical protein NL676_028562 [Syzygium grande]
MTLSRRRKAKGKWTKRWGALLSLKGKRTKPRSPPTPAASPLQPSFGYRAPPCTVLPSRSSPVVTPLPGRVLAALHQCLRSCSSPSWQPHQQQLLPSEVLGPVNSRRSQREPKPSKLQISKLQAFSAPALTIQWLQLRWRTPAAALVCHGPLVSFLDDSRLL